MLNHYTLDDYTEALAEGSPTPGGGAAAGLSAAQAASLTNMVLNFTIGHKTAEDYPEVLQEALKSARDAVEQLRLHYLQLMSADAKAFDSLMKAYRLPKETEEERALRSEQIRTSKKDVLYVPWTLLSDAYRLYRHLLLAVKHGNRNVLSDAGIAAVLLHSAIESSGINIEINLASMKNQTEASWMRERTKEIVGKSHRAKEDVLEMVDAILRKA